MRTFEEIHSSIKTAWISNQVLRSAYRLSTSKTFDEQFSAVSVESALVYIFASVTFVIERIVYGVAEQVQQLLDGRQLYGEQWYYDKAMSYQDGYPLVYDSEKFTYAYEADDLSARIVKFAAVREVDVALGKAVRVMVAGIDKKPLSTEQMTRFTEYMHRISPAGIVLQTASGPATKLRITVQIFRDVLVMDGSGQSIVSGNYLVVDAVKSYLDGIKYGGEFNKTRLVDALQATSGVTDVILSSVRYYDIETSAWQTLAGNSLNSEYGCFEFDQAGSTITYQIGSDD